MLSLRRVNVLLALLLVAGTLLVYWPAAHYDFVNYDDQSYFTANAHVQAGLTSANFKWAFTTGTADNWHPLTWLSLMLDVDLFGAKAAGVHLTNLILHALDVVLLFWLLLRLTNAPWRSAAVAALFAWHPLHVESVAWISERKDVLSAFFGWLTLIFYVCYAQSQEKVEREKMTAGDRVLSSGDSCHFTLRSSLSYGLAWFFLALGLMSKSMLVTWPFVLLLLDYWPLTRWQPGHVKRLVIEKIPFFALSIAASVVTFLVQRHEGAMVTVQSLPLGMRLGNAVVSYGRYLGKLIWPAKLAVFYPHPGYWPATVIIFSGSILIIISLVCYRLRRRQGFLLVGWLWYLGTLVPVIGLVQVGAQSMADRYTYIPSVGIFIALVWGVSDVTRLWACRRLALGIAGLVVVACCLIATRTQLAYWRNSETLFNHALAVTDNNYIAHNNMGLLLLEQGQTNAAIAHFKQTVKICPAYAQAHNNLGEALLSEGRIDEAATQLEQAIDLKPTLAGAHNSLGTIFSMQDRIDDAINQFMMAIHLDPDFAAPCYNLGVVFVKKGRTDEAIRQFRQAIRLKPENANAHNNLGNLLANQNQTDDAIREFRAAIHYQPDYVQAHNQLGAALFKKGEVAGAIGEYQSALRIRPDNAEIHNNLGTALASQGNTDAARREFETAVRLRPDDASFHDNLGIAFANQGQTNAAIEQFQRALELVPSDAEAAGDLGALWVEQNEHLAEAKALISLALKSDPKNGDLLGSMGWVLFKLNQPAEGLTYMQKAIAVTSPPDAELYDHLGDLYSALNQRERARAAWQKSLSLKPNLQISQKLADAGRAQ